MAQRALAEIASAPGGIAMPELRERLGCRRGGACSGLASALTWLERTGAVVRTFDRQGVAHFRAAPLTAPAT